MSDQEDQLNQSSPQSDKSVVIVEEVSNPKPKKKKNKKKPKPPTPPPKPRKKPQTPPPLDPDPPAEEMGIVGVLVPFDPAKDDFGMWVGTFRCFLQANELDETSEADRCKGIFLSSVGITTYTLLSNLLSPDQPTDKKLDVLIDTLEKYFKPPPKALAERYKFTGRTQQHGESANQFLAALRTLAINCKFTDLKDRIRDQFIFGLQSEAAQRSLFTQDDNISLDDAVKIAVAQETAAASTAIVRGHQSTTTGEEQVHKATSYGSQQQQHQKKKGNIKGQHQNNQNSSPQQQSSSNNFKEFSCGRCGSKDHSGNKCPFREAKCYHCDKIGHIKSACRSKKPQQNNKIMDNGNVIDIKNVESTTDNDIIWMDCKINGVSHKMEMDSGCKSAVLGEDFWRNELGSPPLQKTPIVFRTYTREVFRPLGVLPVKIEYKGQKVEHLIPISKGTSLFGRNLLRTFKIDWNDIANQCNNVSAKVPTSAKLQELLAEFQDVFKKPTAADRIQNFKARIYLKEDATPKFLKARPLPYNLREKVERELDEMEAIGAITKVETSEWASPLVVVPKPNGKVRITGDFKNTVNNQLHVTQYPLANPDDLFVTVSGGSTYSKLDGSNAYHQIEITEESKKFLVINTHKGLYRYNVLPQGIASSPAIFQQFVDNMLRGIPKTGSFVDDAITTGKTDDQHLKNLRLILERMKTYNYKLSREKCQFMQQSIEYLGHRISKLGIETTAQKVEDIVNMPQPRDVSEVRSFLGLVGFYSKFMKDLSCICEPLHRLTRDNVPFVWNGKCKEAFEAVKKRITTTPVLAHYDPAKVQGISCDSSSYAVGIVLFQKNDDGTEHPLAFFSRLLSETERRYSQIEKEGLAIILGVNKYFKYLWGKKFILVTDHKPLLKIFGPKTQLPPLVATRLHHWSLILSQYIYEVVYRKSSEHGNADALSRLPVKKAEEVNKEEENIHVLASEQLGVLPVTAASIRKATARDPVLSKVQQLILYGWPPKLRDEDKDKLQSYYSRRDELTIVQGVIMWGIRVVIPTTLRNKILQQLHDCHFGIVRMKAMARQHVYWPGIDGEIENIGKSCTTCQQTAPSPPSAPLHPWQFPERPWQRLHVDLAGPLYNRMWLIVVDAHTKWPEVFCMNNNTTSTAVINKMAEVIARFGLPEQIVSDNGRQFVSAEFEDFCKVNNMKHVLSSVYHPRSNGEAERFVRTFKEGMRVEDLRVELRLQRFLLSYRNTPHATTNSSPSELLQGRRLRTTMDLIRPDVTTTVRTNQLKQEAGYNKRVKQREFQVQDTVWVQTFSKGDEKWSLGIIKLRLGPVTYMVEVGDRNLKRHLDQIRSSHRRVLHEEAAEVADEEEAPPQDENIINED